MFQICKYVGAIGLPLAATASLVVALATIDRAPPPFVDESSFVQTSAYFAVTGELRTPLHEGFVPGIETRTYWMTPLLMVLYSPFARAFGESVLAARGVMAVACLLAILFFHRLTRGIIGDHSRRGHRSALVGTGCFTVWFTVSKAFAVFRPEILTLVCSLAAVMAYSVTLDARRYDPAARLAFRAAAFGLTAVAFLAHPFGAVTVAAVAVHSLIHDGRRIQVVSLVLGAAVFVAVCGPWIGYIGEDFATFLVQWKAQFGQKYHRSSSLLLLKRLFVEPVPALPWVMGFVLWRSKPLAGPSRSRARLVALCLMFSHLAYSAGAIRIYSVYDAAWISVGLALWLSFGLPRARLLTVVVAVGAIARSAYMWSSGWPVTGSLQAWSSLEQQVERLVDRLEPGRRVLWVSKTTHVTPFARRGVDIKVPVLASPGDIEAAASEYDLVVFVRGQASRFDLSPVQLQVFRSFERERGVECFDRELPLTVCWSRP